MKKVEARKFVKTHIKKNQYKEVEVTEQLLTYWWRIFNVSLFDKKLPFPRKLIIKDFNYNFLGYCSPVKDENNVRMGIRRTFYDKETFLTVLVHEMVHQYQHVTEQNMNHGKSFFAFQDKIKKYYGLELSEHINWEY